MAEGNKGLYSEEQLDEAAKRQAAWEKLRAEIGEPDKKTSARSLAEHSRHMPQGLSSAEKIKWLAEHS